MFINTKSSWYLRDKGIFICHMTHQRTHQSLYIPKLNHPGYPSDQTRRHQITKNNVFSQVYSQATKYSLRAIQDHMYPTGQISCGTLNMRLCEEFVTAPQTCHEACRVVSFSTSFLKKYKTCKKWFAKVS